MEAGDLPPAWPAPCYEDVEDVKFVINYDYPNSSEDYIHRIGRTARSTNKGTAYTFFTPGNLRQARELVRVLEEARQAINPKLLQLVDSGRGSGGGGGGRSRFRGSGSNSNNPNLMYQEECDRRMRSVGGGGGSSSSSKDSRGNGSSSGGFSRDGRRDGGDRSSSSSSSSYRERGGRDGRGSDSYSSGSNSYSGGGGGGGSSSQYSSYGSSSGGSQYNSRSAAPAGASAASGGTVPDQAGQSQSQFGNIGARSGNPPPPVTGPQPLMAQQFSPTQPMMGFMGQGGPYQFAPPPPPPPSRK